MLLFTRNLPNGNNMSVHYINYLVSNEGIPCFMINKATEFTPGTLIRTARLETISESLFSTLVLPENKP